MKNQNAPILNEKNQQESESVKATGKLSEWAKEIIKWIFILYFYLLVMVPSQYDPSNSIVVFLAILFAVIAIVYGLMFFQIIYKYRAVLTRGDIHIAYFSISVFLIISGIVYIAFSGLFEFLPNLLKVYSDSTSDNPGVIFFGYLAFCFFMAGIYIWGKNFQSMVTLLFFLCFTSFSLSWLILLYYTIQPFYFLMIAFYILIYLGLSFLAHACQLLITPNDPFFPRFVYLILGVSFITTVFLLATQLGNNLFFETDGFQFFWELFFRTRELALLYAMIYLISLLLPVGYSVYRISVYPNWLTSERAKWIKRIRIGIILMIPHLIGVSLAGGIGERSLDGPPSWPGLLSLTLFGLSLSTLIFSIIAIISGLPDVSKWFFEEVKIRATPELQEINPNVNLTAIWEQVDEWQKDSSLVPREMNTQKLQEYIQAVKNILP